MRRTVGMLGLIMLSTSLAKEVQVEEVSVTATRTERKTEDVPASVSVVGKEKLEQKPMLNLYDALQGIPGVNITTRNQGYDTRLIIRGAGLKATYGVREIMVLLNGVPITDPDSLTRLDFVDTSLIERVEVVKGPNSTLWGVNSAGGVINVITRSPFERKGGFIKLSLGDYNTQNHNLYYSTPLGKGLYIGFNASRRQTDNSWRPHNKFWTNQITLQPSYMFEDGSTWENYISYTKASLELPGSLVVDLKRKIDQWSEFKRTGNVPQTADPWRHMGRYSEILFMSSKLDKTFGNFQIIPVIYINHWQHYHPVTGRINDANTWIYGLDFQTNYRHSLGVLTGGFTVRHDDQNTDYFKYRDIKVVGGRIVSTLSDSRGELLERQNQKTTLAGVFLQESIQRGRWIVDMGARLDSVKFDISGYKWGDYSFSKGNYVSCPDPSIDNCFSYSREKTYTAVSPRIGVVYKLSPVIHFYGNISTGATTPSSSELSSNPNLKLAKVINYEVGLKARHRRFSLDTALYLMQVKDEVVRTIQPGGYTQFTNAGKTEKKGLELSGSYRLFDGFDVGVSYAYSDYKFKDFSEIVGSTNVSRNGNRLPYVPMHQYSLFASYTHPSGFRFRVQTDTWGEYYMDNANTEKYGGYDFLTSISVGYAKKNFDVALMVDNLFNKKYAVEVTKDTSGVKRYTPGPPRTFLVRVSYSF
ncbi:MAG: TonB-dependent receptor [Hydrogenobacter thermophilus]|uniref:TonB-dependent receptor n=1 Tax=Hydrogenobacter thermophilus TaxID=940 RepID=UPI001C75C66A|nr:TonB-dependent receptor [Hydrogenobacter thermophilus]QWK19634.1 MAG: TonB-dependent receptor [Hydrogenobacter thermophilus]